MALIKIGLWIEAILAFLHQYSTDAPSDSFLEPILTIDCNNTFILRIEE